MKIDKELRNDIMEELDTMADSLDNIDEMIGSVGGEIESSVKQNDDKIRSYMSDTKEKIDKEASD